MGNEVTTTASLGVVLVGQVPPPIHGQAVATGYLASAKYDALDLIHIPLDFSKSIDDVSRIRPAKVLRLLDVIRAAHGARRQHGPEVLVYAVGMRNSAAVMRDVVLLPILRRLFDRTILHIHSSGNMTVLNACPRPLRRCAELAYGHADAVLWLDEELRDSDGPFASARRHLFLPYGTAHPPVSSGQRREKLLDRPPTVVYLGNLYESKGALDLVEAVAALRPTVPDVRLVLAGGMPSAEMEQKLRELIARLNLEHQVVLPGTVDGHAKWNVLADADVFCFPTRYEAEAMPLVVMEAMSMGLPVVATHWRAIPSLVDDGVTGCLVATQDVNALSKSLCDLLTDSDRAARMGAAGRKKWESEFSIDAFRGRFEELALAVGRGGEPS